MMSKFIIEFDEEKQECPFHIVYPVDEEKGIEFTSRYCHWLEQKCDGGYIKEGWNKNCPLKIYSDFNRSNFNIPFACLFITRNGFKKKIMFSPCEFKQFALDGYKCVSFNGYTSMFMLRYNNTEDGFFIFEEV